MDCSKLESLIHSIDLVTECDEVRNGALRMSTPFMYPNGDFIDVFLQSSNDLFETLSLSDYGHTSLYLRDAQVEMESSGLKRETLKAILAQLNVRLNNGDLSVEVSNSSTNDIGDAIFRLSQACLRISDFAAHQRLRSVNPLRDDIEGFFEASGLQFHPKVRVLGRFNKPVKIDFEVIGGSQNSYVTVLSTMGDNDAHASATETFRKWYDISGEQKQSHNLVTIYSSKLTTLKVDDRKRLQEYSRLVAYPVDQNILKEILAA